MKFICMSVSSFLVGCALGDRIGGVIKGEGFTSSSSLNPGRQVQSES